MIKLRISGNLEEPRWNAQWVNPRYIRRMFRNGRKLYIVTEEGKFIVHKADGWKLKLFWWLR